MARHITPVVTEAMNPNWRARQLELHGHRCRYCGTTEDIEIHHIVPKNQGGDNRDSNIVVLCRRCHAKAHNKMQYQFESRAGRKPIVKPDILEEVIENYLSRQIELQNVLQMLGVGKNTFYKWLDEYKKSTGDPRTHRDTFLGRNTGLTRKEYLKAYASR